MYISHGCSVKPKVSNLPTEGGKGLCQQRCLSVRMSDRNAFGCLFQYPRPSLPLQITALSGIPERYSPLTP